MSSSCPLTTLRNKFADDIEEILQCPVCYTVPSGSAPMCIQGHFVCMKCQPQMQNCPLCQGNFVGTRNYAVEAMAQKFNDIKQSLIDPKNVINTMTVENKMCISTQTDENILNITTNSGNLMANHTNSSFSNNSIDLKVAPATGKGKYPCRIENCQEELPHGRMIPHIRYYHLSSLIEAKAVDDGTYSETWSEVYASGKSFDKAIHITNMGLFFLKAYTDDNGNLLANLQIVNTSLIAQQFQYTLNVGNGHKSFSYKGPVVGCRTAKAKMNEKFLYVTPSLMNLIVNKKLSFSFTITITRKKDSDLSTAE